MFKDIRKAIIAENLFTQVISQRNYPISEKFILGKRVEALNIYTNVENELSFLENYYKDSGECSFILDPSTEVTNIKNILVKHGYSKMEECDEIWWALDLTTANLTESTVAEISELNDYSYLVQALKDSSLHWWADAYGNPTKIKVPDLTYKLYIAKVGETVAAVSAASFYKDIAIFKGSEVVDKFRRKGIHTQMTQRRILDAQKAGCKWAIYQTESKDIAATGAGNKLGFKEAFRREALRKKL